MNAVIAPVAFIVVIAAVIGSLWHFVLQPWLQERMAQPTAHHQARHRLPLQKRLRALPKWLRWIGPRMWLRMRHHQLVARLIVRWTLWRNDGAYPMPHTAESREMVTRLRQRLSDLETEPDDDWSPKKEWGDSPFRPDPIAKLTEITRIPAWRPIPAPALNAPWDHNLVIPARALAPVSSAEHTITNGTEFAGWVRALLACPVDQVASILERQNEALGAS